MRRKLPSAPPRLLLALLVIGAAELCAGAGVRRAAQRRSDSAPTPPPPSMATLGALAAAAGAAAAQHSAGGRVLVKRLVPAADLDALTQQGVIGKPGVDFPAYPSIPATGFNCRNVPTGYYADLETDCQVFHICDTSRKISFLCPNGTIFSQSHLICDWWFKVDCASSPALYESSAEYYSNEQKKTHKVTQSLSKAADLQQIGSDASVRAERPLKRTQDFPSTTERFLRHRQRLQGYSDEGPLPTPQATARSFQSVYPEKQNRQPSSPAGFEKKRKSLVQLIGFNNGKTTPSTYTEASTYRNGGDFNGLKEMQVAAESASFLNNNNRQSIQDYNKNYRPYPVYTPTVPEPRPTPALTTLFEIRSKHGDEATTKRPTLLPYTKSYTYNYNEKRQPYTRPGVSLLKDFLDKERNKTYTTTEKIAHTTEAIKKDDKKDTYETVTKTPQTTRSDNYFSDTASSDHYDYYSTNVFQGTTEASYQERRDRLLRKLNLSGIAQTEPTPAASKETFGKRPGLIVPPSLTPKSLHTLAIYYATAVDNISTTPEPEAEDTTTTPIDNYDNFDENLPALFTQHTINKYSKLFGQDGPNPQVLEEIKQNANETLNELADDLAGQQSQNPLSSSPQLRELAQVFTHALSAYLQDPVQFRKVLSDIRPTQPSFADIVTTEEQVFNTEPTTTINEEDDEILGFSDDNKIGPPLAQLRDGKALNGPTTVFPIYREAETTTPVVTTTEANTSPAVSTTLRNIFKCCGRISASYTTASTPEGSGTTPASFVNTVASNVNTLANNYSEVTFTTDSIVPRYGGFQNNTDDSNRPKYNNGISPDGAKPLSDYVAVTNLPSAWGVDAESTIIPTTDINIFESKKIKPTTYAPGTTPVYFTDKADSVELENEEELQRAHSQSFVTPKENNVQRHGKTIDLDSEVRKPSENLEAPTLATEADATPLPTTQAPTTTEKEYATEAPTTSQPEAFTADGEKSTNQFQWSNAFENWQSTVVLDPITLNDGLSDSAPLQGLSQLSAQTTYVSSYNTATTPTAPEYTGTSEQAFASSQYLPQTTPPTLEERLAKIRLPTSTESGQDLTTIADVVAEKAKEIMGGMNATTTEKLMNVMKKTKSKTVRRLILLLVQTCDDDHNTTAEASKRALLDALMAVSQKDMDEIAKEQEQDTQTTVADYTITNRRTDRITQTEAIRLPKQQRSGKSLNIDVDAVNALSNAAPTTTQRAEEIVQTTASNTTPAPFTRPPNRRGVRKFYVRTQEKPREAPVAEARVANPSEVKPASDTRALELLRSLYTIAARWG